MDGLFDLSGRSVVVTGASSGLGRRFARLLADAGATVYAAARRLDRLEELAQDRPSIRPVRCNVADVGDCAALIALVLADAGRLDVLVNNAGTSGPARIEDEDELERVLATNLRGPFLLAKHAGVAMRAVGRGPSSTSPPSWPLSRPPPSEVPGTPPPRAPWSR